MDNNIKFSKTQSLDRYEHWKCPTVKLLHGKGRC